MEVKEVRALVLEPKLVQKETKKKSYEIFIKITNF